jgi:hypothetical protein
MNLRHNSGQVCRYLGGFFGVLLMFRIPTLRVAVLAAAIGFTGMLSSTALAQESTLEGAQEEAVEGIAKLLQALQLFVKSVPQFSAPEILPNGDIIIRRIHPDKDPEPEKPRSDDDDATST